jgi:2-methylisocitrate lyase-like PEP mutase family enzyme
MKRSVELKQLLHAKETLVMPDAYDAISARIIEQAGFKAVQCSGYRAAFRWPPVENRRLTLGSRRSWP